MAMVACGGTTTKNMYAESPPQPRKVLGMPLVEALRGLARAERFPARAQLFFDVGLCVVGTEVEVPLLEPEPEPELEPELELELEPEPAPLQSVPPRFSQSILSLGPKRLLGSYV